MGRAVLKVHDQIRASPLPALPLIWSEFNASYMTEPEVTDSIYMGPWLANTIRQCDGLVDMMSYWTFSDVFEEQGVVKTPFYGGYGLIAAGGIPKPAFYAFELLHRLGNQRLALDSDSALLTRRKDGTLVMAVWDYSPPGETGSARTVTLRVRNSSPTVASIFRVDRDHGDFHPAYEKMGEPRYPTASQIRELRAAVELPSPETRHIEAGEVTLTLPNHGLAVVELK
jgi:xylan 1,4-beta-xylosidase